MDSCEFLTESDGENENAAKSRDIFADSYPVALSTSITIILCVEIHAYKFWKLLENEDIITVLFSINFKKYNFILLCTCVLYKYIMRKLMQNVLLVYCYVISLYVRDIFVCARYNN